MQRYNIKSKYIGIVQVLLGGAHGMGCLLVIYTNI